jgi:hypothetical protein
MDTLDDKKRTMDNSLMMLVYRINAINHEGRSALPDAPIVPDQPSGNGRRRIGRLQNWLAKAVHQAASAIEPDPPTVTERTRQ